MPTSDSAQVYDVFVSYSHADKEWVWGWLVPRLKEAGLAVCTDHESFDVGVPALGYGTHLSKKLLRGRI